jgi:hypothetical protein
MDRPRPPQWRGFFVLMDAAARARCAEIGTTYRCQPYDDCPASRGAFSFRRHGTCLCSAVRGPLPLPLALIRALPPWGLGSIEHDDLAPLRRGFFIPPNLCRMCNQIGPAI